MGTKERRERERAERRELILGTAAEIIGEDGADGLSMRKIADRIEYSPALIYHYFKNKEEILDALMERGFQKIVGSLRGAVLSPEEPELQFREFIRKYIDNALANPDEYRSALLSSSPGVLKYTALLFRGASQKPSVGMIQRFLHEAFFEGSADEGFVELTVQIIWASMFGLIIRVLVEKTSEDQIERLVDHHIEMMLGAVNWMTEKANEEDRQ